MRAGYIVITVLFVLIIQLSPAIAGEMPVQWTPTGDQLTAGYDVEVLDAAGRMLFVIDAGKQTSITLTGLTDGEMHRVRIRPYDDWNQKARQPSSELVGMPLPRIERIAGELSLGSSVLAISGANFLPGARVISKRSDIAVVSSAVIGHQKLLVTVQAFAGTTLPGPDELLVVNPMLRSLEFARQHPELLDVDRSGSIDQQDVEQIQLNYGASRGSENYAERMDANGDGMIDGEDAAMVRALIAEIAHPDAS